MTFYLDENLSPRIARALRIHGIDAVSAHDVGNLRLTDEEQLAFAAHKGRCLVTGNIRDFIRLSREAIIRQRPHAGIALCPVHDRRSDVGAIVRALVRIAARHPRGLGEYNVIYL